MKLALQANELPEPLVDTLTELTSAAIVRPAEVQYDPAACVVTVPLTRFSYRRRFLLRPRIDPTKGIAAELRIRNVQRCIIEQHTTDLDSVQLLFGVRVKGHAIYLGSAEEERGVTCYSMDMQVSSIDLELADLA